ncbi:MAG: hypothetical protein DWH91_08510 [Planctomycetota bacterium]|nr:MAG: hypothetical protein DWH91_08510 [Planctomycetota bacterium]
MKRQWTWIGSLVLICGVASAADEQRRDPREMIDRLAARSFSQRIAAENALYESGHRILPYLESGLTHPNPEVRLRVETLIQRVSRSQLGETITDFLAPGSQTTLPGWDLVAEVTGDRPETRQVYGELLRGDTDLSAALSQPDQIEAELRRRVMLPGMPRLRDARGVSALSLLILLTHPEAEHPDDVARSAYYLLRQLVNQNATTPEDTMKLTLVAYWVTQPAPNLAQDRFELANRLGLPEAIHPAMELIDNPRRQFQIHEPFAVIAHYGGSEEMAALEKLLTDTTELSASRGENDAIKSTTQLRDLALAALIEMTKQDPETYGLKPFRRDPSGQIRNMSVAFDSEEARNKAFAQWKTWSTKNLKKFLAPPNEAAEGFSI